MRLTLAMILAITTSCLLSDEDGDPANYVAVTDIDAAFKDANCTYLASCGIFEDKASCLSAELAVTSAPLGIDDNVAAAVAAGRIVYNGSNVKTCFDHVAARSCDKTSQGARMQLVECRDVLRGTVPGGEPCMLDAECISGVCTGGIQVTSCVMGVCVGDVAPDLAPKPIGEECGTDAECMTAAYCDPASGTCTALKPNGAGCTLANECAYGLGCTGQTGARTCAALPPAGQPCSSDGLCRDEGTYCDFNDDTCKKLGLSSATCSSSSNCSLYYPCDFDTLLCTKGPSRGELCASSERCFDAGTYCDFTTSTCAPVKETGAPCDSPDECASGLCELNASAVRVCTAIVCF